ncbi:hypothetical protein CPU12_10970 [Malaciobacter molluscorum LMG 25693]|uniref:Uncharacterized protein n=1 Tax=Malaciobacter molluscorum LMG 25693 TaxID=870501 RepID=A0A2G1DFP9_9BACT|nr:hypothetical protein [Malaciobacter molluscorum]AXX93621.1 hypothetical protein AMOL_2683 [Malaciobacter molluscorum LMG 25693]PHO17328.1 hypothetical protein CPU12_10970 [Malaciobacter molluscorum LMG 25693]
MENHTKDFINLIEKVLDENNEYFKELNNIKQEDKKELIIKIFENNKLNLNDYKDDNGEIPYLILGKPFEVHIKKFILSFKDSFSINVEILKDISKQIEIDYLLKTISKEKANFYWSISNALIYYGIYKNGKIVSFQNVKFWKELIKKLYSLNLLQEHYPNFYFEEEGYPHPDFNHLTRLINDKNIIEKQLKEKLEIVDGIVIFKKGQGKRIVEKIEKKLAQCNLFYFLKFIFELYYKNKKINNIEYTIPYKYIINILIKNISKSNDKPIDIKEVMNIKNLLSSFIGLYQLKENKFEMMDISSTKLVTHLRNQVLYANFYPIYELKTDVLIQYIDNIVKPSIKDNKELFLEKFGFTIESLIDFFLFIDKEDDDILILEKNNIFDYDLKILEFYSIDASFVNSNYSTIDNLKETNNLFAMNPVLKYENKYFIIGYKCFKMNFYTSLVEKIRHTIDKAINQKIGENVDIFLESIFEDIKDKHKYEIFSGNYTPPKKDNPESDLALKLEKDIIFFENKNKYLTAQSFSGSETEILKDLTLSFVFSQKQLFKHERNIKKYKKLVFHKQKKLVYNNENIIKISVSTNNWFNIMNNSTKTILTGIIKLGFIIDSFSDAKKYLNELQDILIEISQHKDFDMNISLNQTLFLPLELIVDKYKDDNFIEILKTLVATCMNTDNILHTYDYIQYIKSHKD